LHLQFRHAHAVGGLSDLNAAEVNLAISQATYTR